MASTGVSADAESEGSSTEAWVAHWEQDDWLAATNQGLWLGQPGQPWRASGPYSQSLNCLARQGEDLVVGADGGLWRVCQGAHRWQQLHDELVTVVHGLGVLSGAQDGLLVATGYGVHRPVSAADNVLRWDNCSASLTSPSARFSTALHLISAQEWLVGTEAGLFFVGNAGQDWTMTNLVGTAVRALLSTRDGFWAGSDDGEIWFSEEGRQWARHSRVDEGEGVYSLCEREPGSLLVGTSRGIALQDQGRWRHVGPPVTISSVVADPRQSSVWLAGATPGGLWWTTGGEDWQQVPGAPRAVRHLLAPENPV